MSPAAATVAVVIPAWNAGRWIAATLDSVLAQSYRPLDIVVVDDGSTDDTAAVVARYAPTVRYLHQRNQGQAAARNHGVSASRGEFIAFLDSDNLWLPDKLAHQVALLHACPGAPLAFCNYVGFGELAGPPGFSRGPVLARLASQPVDARITAPSTDSLRQAQGEQQCFPFALSCELIEQSKGRTAVTTRLLIAEDQVTPLLDDLFCQVPSTWLLRRTAFEQAGGFDPTLRHGGEDWLLAARLALLGPFACDSRILAQRREFPTSHSRNTDALAGLTDALQRLLSGAELPAAIRQQVADRLAVQALNLGLAALRTHECTRARDWLALAWRHGTARPAAQRWKHRLRCLIGGALSYGPVALRRRLLGT